MEVTVEFNRGAGGSTQGNKSLLCILFACASRGDACPFACGYATDVSTGISTEGSLTFSVETSDEKRRRFFLRCGGGSASSESVSRFPSSIATLTTKPGLDLLLLLLGENATWTVGECSPREESGEEGVPCLPFASRCNGRR